MHNTVTTRCSRYPYSWARSPLVASSRREECGWGGRERADRISESPYQVQMKGTDVVPWNRKVKKVLTPLAMSPETGVIPYGACIRNLPILPTLPCLDSTRPWATVLCPLCARQRAYATIPSRIAGVVQWNAMHR